MFNLYNHCPADFCNKPENLVKKVQVYLFVDVDIYISGTTLSSDFIKKCNSQIKETVSIIDIPKPSQQAPTHTELKTLSE